MNDKLLVTAEKRQGALDYYVINYKGKEVTASPWWCDDRHKEMMTLRLGKDWVTIISPKPGDIEIALNSLIGV
jgi:hypothetical protein